VAVEELIARLERDTERRIGELRAQAEREAAALKEQGARRREEIEQRGLQAFRAALSARLERDLAAARQRARAERLEALHAVIDRVLARAGELFAEVVGTEAWARDVARRTAEALRYVEGLEHEVAAAPLGVKVVARGGAVVIDETLGARLERETPRLKIVLARELRP